MPRPPNVLVLSGHDPSGGAGLQADIEAIAALGAHPAVVITALTRQDSGNAYEVWPEPGERFASVLATLEADMEFAAVKVGLVGSVEQIDCIATYALAHPGAALVVDPVLRAGGGGALASDPVARALRERLFRHAAVLTPNAAEARSLCPGLTDIDRCGALLSRLAGHVLITGGDEPGAQVVNRLYADGEPVRRFSWPRLPHRFHGSGCTLAAALAARLALGDDVAAAAEGAQHYVHACLESGFAPGGGQHIPQRRPRAL